MKQWEVAAAFLTFVKEEDKKELKHMVDYNFQHKNHYNSPRC